MGENIEKKNHWWSLEEMVGRKVKTPRRERCWDPKVPFKANMKKDRPLPIQRLEGIWQHMIPKLKSQTLLSASSKCSWGSSYSYEERFVSISKECTQTHFLRNNAILLSRVESTDRSHLENLKAAQGTLFNKHTCTTYWMPGSDLHVSTHITTYKNIIITPIWQQW